MQRLSSICEAVEQFRSAAIRKRAILNAREDHRLHAEMKTAFRWLKARGPEGRNAFDELLFDECLEVSSWVAAQLLSERREEAVPVLLKIQELGGLLGFEARIVLEEYEAGRLGSPFGGD